jgi:hypothetical protein
MNEPTRTDGAGGDAGLERLAQRARQAYREGAANLDGATLSRLNRARQAALEEYDRREAVPAWRRWGWQPAGAFATVAAVAVAASLLWGPGLDTRGADPIAHVEHAGDLEVVLADENLEMLDDLDVIEWLEPGDDANPAPAEATG